MSSSQGVQLAVSEEEGWKWRLAAWRERDMNTFWGSRSSEGSKINEIIKMMKNNNRDQCRHLISVETSDRLVDHQKTEQVVIFLAKILNFSSTSFLKCQYSLLFFLLCNKKFNIFVFCKVSWTKQNM